MMALFFDTISNLLKLYGQGGIEVLTPSPAAAAGLPPDEMPLLARTLIQPDGDVITHISPDLLAPAPGGTGPDGWRLHQAEVNRRVNSVHQLRRLLRSVWVLFPLPVVWPLATGNYDFWRELDAQLVIVVAMGVVPLLIRPLAGLLFRWWWQRGMG